MSFNYLKMLNEGFVEKYKATEYEYVSERDLDRKINECISNLKSIKLRYEELKESWKSLSRDAEALSLGRHLSGDGMLTESFNKAIEDLKMEYAYKSNSSSL